MRNIGNRQFQRHSSRSGDCRFRSHKGIVPVFFAFRHQNLKPAAAHHFFNPLGNRLNGRNDKIKIPVRLLQLTRRFQKNRQQACNLIVP